MVKEHSNTNTLVITFASEMQAAIGISQMKKLLRLSKRKSRFAYVARVGFVIKHFVPVAEVKNAHQFGGSLSL